MLAGISSSVAINSDGSTRILDPDRVPTAEQRQYLETRCAKLRQWLAVRDVESERKALRVVFATSKASREERENHADLVEVYLVVLNDLPSWAVTQACVEIARGAGQSDTFTPAAAEIHNRAELLAAPHRHELSKIENILKAQLPSRPLRRESAQFLRWKGHSEESQKPLPSWQDKPLTEEAVASPSPELLAALRRKEWLAARQTTAEEPADPQAWRFEVADTQV
jgi:CDP-glycerol glycerophosphotransferase (TagB/SpsB family)